MKNNFDDYKDAITFNENEKSDGSLTLVKTYLNKHAANRQKDLCHGAVCGIVKGTNPHSGKVFYVPIIQNKANFVEDAQVVLGADGHFRYDLCGVAAPETEKHYASNMAFKHQGIDKEGILYDSTSGETADALYGLNTVNGKIDPA